MKGFEADTPGVHGPGQIVMKDRLDREAASDGPGAVGLRVEAGGNATGVTGVFETAPGRRNDLISMERHSPASDRLDAVLAQWLAARAGAATGAVPPAVAAPAGAALIRRLEAVDGLEVPTALRNVGGQAQILARVLERFAGSYAAGEPSLLAAPSAESPRRWRSLCHSIRGSAATIGATRLADDAQALESGLRSGARPAAVAAQAAALHEALKSLAARLASALAGEQRE